MVTLKKAQMTDQPVKSQFGWHIIKLEDVRDVKVPTMAEIKDQLKQMIKSLFSKPIKYEAGLDKLRKYFQNTSSIRVEVFKSCFN